ncbi:MAG: hypothetical protein H0X31_24345 [Nostocaceae cyanobacterium]|nr:hypothetical protein [Nostocaceae cyanobacterium]
MEQIHTEDAFHAQILQTKPTVAVFKAAWCQDCHYMITIGKANPRL